MLSRLLHGPFSPGLLSIDFPRPQGMLIRGNINLDNRPVVHNKDGSYSTVRTITTDMNGNTVLLPTIVNGKVLSNQDAIQHYLNTGEHMGIFKTSQDADKYDEQLHNMMGWTGPNNVWP